MKELTLWQRIKAPTPAFWRRVQVRGVVVGATLSGLSQLPGLPPALSSFCIYAAFACGIAVALAQATADSPPSPPTDPA